MFGCADGWLPDRSDQFGGRCGKKTFKNLIKEKRLTRSHDRTPGCAPGRDRSISVDAIV